MTMPKPLVWLPADHRVLGDGDQAMPFLVLGDKYARAVQTPAGLQSVVFPLAALADIDALLSLVDGVFLTGSPSNVHPERYGADLVEPVLPLDVARDALTLPLLQACLARSVPVLGICRGFQEINVALGGTLHPRVHACAGMQDHREDKQASVHDKYAPSHTVRLTPGSVFAQWAQAESAWVNSLHGQGIDRLAPDLEPMAFAPDGLVEAFGVQNASSFAYAVQWHPEWRPLENPFYSAILTAFGDACRAHQQQRLHRKPYNF